MTQNEFNEFKKEILKNVENRNPHLRYGQSVYIESYKALEQWFAKYKGIDDSGCFYPDVFNNQQVDCFYVDANVDLFLKTLEKELVHQPIEFRDKENYCRWNGILMDPVNTIKLLGTDEEFSGDLETIILSDEVIYTDLSISQVILYLGYIYHKPERSFTGKIPNYGLMLLENQFDDKVVLDSSDLSYLDNIKPFSQFKIDYPDFKKEAYKSFYADLDAYYESLKA